MDGAGPGDDPPEPPARRRLRAGNTRSGAPPRRRDMTWNSSRRCASCGVSRSGPTRCTGRARCTARRTWGWARRRSRSAPRSVLPPRRLLASGTYRGHAHALARGASPEAVLRRAARPRGRDLRRQGRLDAHHQRRARLLRLLRDRRRAPADRQRAGLGQQDPAAPAQVTVCFFGDGATNIGAFHEAVNLAAVWQLPVVFVCENNQYMEYTPIGDGHPGRAPGRRPGRRLRAGPDRRRRQRRVRGPRRWSAPRSAPPGPAAGRRWSRRRPTGSRATRPPTPAPTGRPRRSRRWTCAGPAAARPGRCSQPAGTAPDEARRDRRADQGRPGRAGRAGAGPAPSPTRPGPGPTCGAMGAGSGGTDLPAGGAGGARARRWRRDGRVVLLGEDIGSGGVFKTTAGLRERVRGRPGAGTPRSPSRPSSGAAMGAAMAGLRPVAEIMFSDFYATCWDQVANEIAKIRYMTGGQVTPAAGAARRERLRRAWVRQPARPVVRELGDDRARPEDRLPVHARPRWSACWPRRSGTTTRCWCSSTRACTGARRRCRTASTCVPLGQAADRADGHRRHPGRAVHHGRAPAWRPRPSWPPRGIERRGDRPAHAGAAGRGRRARVGRAHRPAGDRRGEPRPARLGRRGRGDRRPRRRSATLRRPGRPGQRRQRAAAGGRGRWRPRSTSSAARVARTVRSVLGASRPVAQPVQQYPSAERLRSMEIRGEEVLLPDVGGVGVPAAALAAGPGARLAERAGLPQPQPAGGLRGRLQDLRARAGTGRAGHPVRRRAVLRVGGARLPAGADLPLHPGEPGRLPAVRPARRGREVPAVLPGRGQGQDHLGAARSSRAWS